MRYRYLIHSLTFVALFALDFIFQSLFNTTHLTHIFFVSHLHFVGLVLYAREDDRVEITTKVLLVCLVMDLLQFKSFPVYYISYGLSILIIRFWHRHISDTYFERVLIVSLALFIKETLLFNVLKFQGQVSINYFMFLSSRSLWIILFTSVLLPIPYQIIKRTDKMMKNYASRHYQ